MNKNEYPNFIMEFSNYLLAIKNLSDIYISDILTTLKQFFSFINVHKYNGKYNSIKSITLNDIRSLSNSDIYSFIYFLAENHYKIGSRILKIEHLKKFFDYLYRIKNNIFTEPFKKIKREKNIYTQLPNYLSLEESQRLLNLYANSKKSNQIRDNAIFHLFLNCGLRLSELVNLNITDFNFSTDTFVILGKGNKERIGYLNNSTKKALLKYLDIRKNIKTKSSQDDDALFLSNEKNRINIRTINLSIKKAYSKTGINSSQYSVHTLRHTCATLLYKQCVDIKIIKEILGHARVETTQIYTHLFDKDVMKAMQEHPLSKFKMENAQVYCA